PVRLGSVPPARPARRVVAREDTVEIVAHEGADQRRRVFRGRFIRRADLTTGEVLASEGRVAAEDDAAGLRQIHDQRLVTGRVSRRWHDLDAGRDAYSPRDGHVRQFRDVPVHAREVRLALREREVVSLDDEGRLRKRAVVAGVVIVEMAVADVGYIVSANA